MGLFSSVNNNQELLSHNLKAWSFDVQVASTGSVVGSAGVVFLNKVFPPLPMNVISTCYVWCGVAGATLGNVGFALYTAAGALITSSVNANGATVTAFQSTGLKTVTFTPSTITGPFYLGFWFTGTTLPSLGRAGGFGGAMQNVGQASPNYRYATSGSGLTTTAPASVATMASAGIAYWVGLA